MAEKNIIESLGRVILIDILPPSVNSMETFSFASAVRGYHVYRDVWKPSIGEKLVAKREFHNLMDKHTGKVVRGDETVAHLSRKLSQITYFLARSGEIGFEVIGHKQCGGLGGSMPVRV